MVGIDIHTHLIPGLSAEELALVGLQAGTEADGTPIALSNGKRVGPTEIYRADALSNWLDSANLTGALVSVPPPVYRQGHSRDVTRSWVRALNSALTHELEPHPRLVPLAYLPLDSPEVANSIAMECAASSGFAGFSGAAGGQSVSLADSRFYPLWETLADANLPLILHPATSPDCRLEDFYLHNLLGNPVETGIAASQLIFGDVLSRYPNVRIALLHCGGVVPSLVGRWERGVETSRPNVNVRTDVRGQIRSLWTDCLAHDSDVVTLASQTFGIDHLLLGSDWPFPMGTDDPISLIEHLEKQQSICVSNPLSFLGSGIASTPFSTLMGETHV